MGWDVIFLTIIQLLLEEGGGLTNDQCIDKLVTFSDNTTKVLLTHKTCFNLSSCIDFIGVNIVTSFMKKCSFKI